MRKHCEATLSMFNYIYSCLRTFSIIIDSSVKILINCYSVFIGVSDSEKRFPHFIESRSKLGLDFVYRNWSPHKVVSHYRLNVSRNAVKL